MRKFSHLLLISLMAAVFWAGPGVPGLRAGDDPRAKVLMEEALRLYTEKQYIRALDLFKQVDRIQPNDAIVEDYISNTEKRIQEWEQMGGQSDKVSKDKSATWDSILGNKDGKGREDNSANAKDIIAARRSLVERMKTRSTNTENIVKITDTKRGLDILLYHDQLFLPGLLTLRDEALPILENVVILIRDKGDRPVTVHSLARNNSTDPFLLFPDSPLVEEDPTLPKTKTKNKDSSYLFQDIEATRSLILFTYIAQRSMGPVPQTVSAQ